MRNILGSEATKARAHDSCSFSWDGSYSIIICDLLQGSERARYVSDSEELLKMYKSVPCRIICVHIRNLSGVSIHVRI